ncbi:MAG: hypothetical protein D6778_05205 [Nitrospirae bacterium]|nr:MAG: hypothetical protein D6778_05205 [Nitrospirota bacterium]
MDKVSIFNVHKVQEDMAKCPPARYIRALRSLSFLIGVLRNQKADPLCPYCISYASMVKLAKESWAVLREVFQSHDVPEKLRDLYDNVLSGIEEVQVPDYPVAQKKAGNCKLPEGVCFSKTGLEEFLQDILNLKE